MTDALLDEVALLPDSVVLDLAAGSGDPALSVEQRPNVIVAGGGT
jgi:ubiquinone/menaquinone biosynthesis C-methylase UbiE